MAYATRASVILASGGDAKATQLADWNNDKRIDDDVITAAIDAADGLINSYLGMRYTVPVADPGALVRDMSAAGAVYWMREQRNMITPDDVKAYEQRMALLVELRDGKIRPTDPMPESGGASDRDGFIEFTSPVSRKNSRGMW